MEAHAARTRIRVKHHAMLGLGAAWREVLIVPTTRSNYERTAWTAHDTEIELAGRYMTGEDSHARMLASKQ